LKKKYDKPYMGEMPVNYPAMGAGMDPMMSMIPMMSMMSMMPMMYCPMMCCPMMPVMGPGSCMPGMGTMMPVMGPGMGPGPYMPGMGAGMGPGPGLCMPTMPMMDEKEE